MLGSLEAVEDDWTSVIDDIDRFGLAEKACPLVPPSQLHRIEHAPTSYSDVVEETKGERMKLIVHMVPAFGLKELSVYADPNQLIQIGKKFTFDVPESVFAAIDIDE